MGYFQVLEITNKESVNIVELVFCGMIEHPLDMCPRVVQLGLLFAFLRSVSLDATGRPSPELS